MLARTWGNRGLIPRWWECSMAWPFRDSVAVSVESSAVVACVVAVVLTGISPAEPETDFHTDSSPWCFQCTILDHPNLQAAAVPFAW